MNGRYTKTSHRIEGFSLIEVLISLVLLGIISGLASSSFPYWHKTTTRFLAQTGFEEKYYIFLLLLQGDYQKNELLTVENLTDLDNLNFHFDHNFDGDYLDTGELISYRWNQVEKRLERKSGKGSFQSLLENIDAFEWDRISSDPLCHQLKINSNFLIRKKIVKFCNVL